MISATQKNHCRITEQFGGTLNRYATPSCYATVAPIRSDLRYPRRIGLQQSTKPTAPLMPIRSDATPTLHGGEPLCTQTENNNRYAVVKLHYEQYVAYTPNLLRSDRGRNIGSETASHDHTGTHRTPDRRMHGMTPPPSYTNGG
jgi:hypothetical protein